MMRSTIIVYLVLSSLITFAQSNEDIEVLKSAVVTSNKKNYKAAKNNNNEIEFVLSTLFRGYKKFVSSQDMNNCSFSPSCSVYALKAIKSQGLVFGGLNFFDRFTRCNGLNDEHYKKDYKKILLIDNVRDSRFKLVLH